MFVKWKQKDMVFLFFPRNIISKSVHISSGFKTTLQTETLLNPLPTFRTGMAARQPTKVYRTPKWRVYDVDISSQGATKINLCWQNLVTRSHTLYQA